MNFAICIINIDKPELLDVIWVDARMGGMFVWQEKAFCLAKMVSLRSEKGNLISPKLDFDRHKYNT